MTRINCVPVKQLTDSHLLAEYREITRVSRLARPVDDPGKYRMGNGHITFFYDKGQYLMDRTEELYQECLNRGFKVSHKKYLPHPRGLNNDWRPELVDLMTNWDRLIERMDYNVGRNKYYGKPVKFLDRLYFLNRSDFAGNPVERDNDDNASRNITANQS